MVFPKSRPNADNICVTLGHMIIERVHTYRYLGVITDDQLNWCNHNEYTRRPKKVSHYQESSLNRIKNRQCGYISHQFQV